MTKREGIVEKITAGLPLTGEEQQYQKRTWDILCKASEKPNKIIDDLIEKHFGNLLDGPCCNTQSI